MCMCVYAFESTMSVDLGCVCVCVCIHAASKTHHDQCQSFVELLKALRPKARTLRPFVKSSFDNLIATLLMMLETELDKGEPTALHEDE